MPYYEYQCDACGRQESRNLSFPDHVSEYPCHFAPEGALWVCPGTMKQKPTPFNWTWGPGVSN